MNKQILGLTFRPEARHARRYSRRREARVARRRPPAYLRPRHRRVTLNEAFRTMTKMIGGEARPTVVQGSATGRARASADTHSGRVR